MRYPGLIVVIAAAAAALVYSSLESSSAPGGPQDDSDATPTVVPHRVPGPPPEMRPPGTKSAFRLAPARAQHRPRAGLPRREHRALGQDDGALPAGTTVFDHGIPGLANLDADLLDALRQAASDAADDEVEFFVNSGWRSPAYQERLLHEAVAKYGSEEEAARWVATPTTSAHVSGDAVDIGPLDATTWLTEHGAQYGLCQIYRNESWHYELRPRAIDGGCPPMYADPTHDPTVQAQPSFQQRETQR